MGAIFYIKVFLIISRAEISVKDDTDPKDDFNRLIKFSYFYFEATLECFLCTEQIKNWWSTALILSYTC